MPDISLGSLGRDRKLKGKVMRRQHWVPGFQKSNCTATQTPWLSCKTRPEFESWLRCEPAKLSLLRDCTHRKMRLLQSPPIVSLFGIRLLATTSHECFLWPGHPRTHGVGMVTVPTPQMGDHCTHLGSIVSCWTAEYTLWPFASLQAQKWVSHH